MAGVMANTVEQSTFWCVLLGCISGLLEVLSRTVVAYPVHLEKQRRKFTPWFHRCMVGLNICLQLLSTTIAGASSFYGPVGIDLPILLGSEVVLSLLVFGPLLRMEIFSTNMWIGTGLTLLGMVLLPALGPQVQDEQNILLLLSSPTAIAWSFLLLAMLAFSALALIYAAFCRKSKYNQHRGGLPPKTLYTVTIIMTAQLSEAVVSTTLSKMLVLVDGLVFWITLIGYISSISVAIYAFLLQSTAVTQGIFVPIFASGTIMVNSITGIIVWDEGPYVRSWSGYALVMVMLLIGNFMVAMEDPNDHDEESASHKNQLLLSENSKDPEQTASTNDNWKMRKRAAK